tara:strand:+ start:639 stop:857 length:219 start_codon:yes stop_codon:yes gene_type:complete
MTFFAIMEKLDQIEEKIDGVDRWLVTSDACKYCGLSPKSLKRAVMKGALKCSTATGKNLYLKSNLDNWLRNY